MTGRPRRSRGTAARGWPAGSRGRCARGRPSCTRAQGPPAVAVLSSASVGTPAAARAFASSSSKSSPGTSNTVRPNIWIRRRYESQAKRSSWLRRASPSTLESFRPMSRIVSIIPGMENFAPERTDSSSGSRGSPNVLPIRVCITCRWRSTSASRPVGIAPVRRYSRHASVVMVKPGGTGSPIRVISARLAPLPPSRSLRSLFPSMKSYTYPDIGRSLALLLLRC